MIDDIYCPKCKKRYKTKDPIENYLIHCPVCGNSFYPTEPDLYTDKIEMIKKNALCVTAWEERFISGFYWQDDSMLSKKEKAVIDTIFLREN